MSQTIPGSPDDDDLPGRVDLPDEILGGDGNDSIQGLGAGAGEADRMFGEAGDDTIVSSGTGSAYLDGGTGNDSLLAGAEGINSVVGGAGDDTVIGSDGTDYISGDAYDLFGAGPSTDSGNDVIDGGNGDDVISGGPGDDTLSPGAAGTGFDQVFGGDGNDVLALEGAPQDYAIDPFTNFLVSIPTTGPGSGVRADVQDVEQVAFGVTSLELANGAVPLTLVDWVAMFDGLATNSGIGRPHFSLSDTVPGTPGETQVAISIANLLANDFDPDGDVLTFVDITPTAGAGISGFFLVTDAVDITSEGYDPADFPEGLLLAFLDAPLTDPLRFTYRTQMEANGFVELGSTATVTINPVAAVDDRILGSFGGETFIPYATLLANDGPGAVFGGISNEYVFGGTIVDDPGRGGIVIDFPGFYRETAFFEYSLVGIAGTAFVEVDLHNSPPITTPIARVVTPGTSFFLSFDDIRDKPGNFDPDNTGLPPLVQVSGAAGPDVTYSLSATGIDLTFAPGYSGGFSLDYTLTDQPLLATSLPSTISFILAAPPAPLTVNEVLNWGINSDGGTLFQGRFQGFGQIYARELLANDMAMPGSVILANSPRDTTPLDENLAIRSIEFGVPGLDGVTSRSDTAFGFEFKDNFAGSDTYEYIVVDPLGRSATGLITLNVNIPQPVLTDTVIIVPTGATSVTVSAADILDDDTFFGTGAIARINANVATAAEFSAVDSGVYIGAGYTRLDGFTLNFNPARTLDSYQFNVLTFDTAAAGGSASGWQRVTFQQADPSPPPVFRLLVIENVMVEGTAPDPGGYIAFAIERLAGGALGASTVSVAVAGSGAQPAAADDVIGGFATRQVSFAAGETYATFSLQMTPDALDESDEHLTLMLTGATFGTVDATPVTAIIFDDDVTLPAPVFTLRLIENVETEGTPPGPGGYIAFRVERDAGSDLGAATVRAAVSAAGPNPIDGDDLATGFSDVQIVFAEGQTHAQFSLQAVPDAAFEPDETLSVSLVLTTLGTVDGTPVLATIINDDLPPPVFRLSVIENVMAEGTAPDPGGYIAFAIERLAGGALGASTVSIAVAGSGAQPAAADDVIGGFATREVSFAAGETFAFFSLQMTPDALDESDEQLTLTLTGATFGTVDATPVTAIIFNDDVFPEVALVAGSFSAFEGNTLGGVIPVTIRRTGDLSYATEVTFAVAGLDTTTAADIAIIADGGTPIGAGFGSFKVTFDPGVADRIINIVAAGDTVPEADERFTLTLTGASLGTLSATEPLSITGTIVNDDLPPEIAFAAADVGATPEGNGIDGRLAFVLTRTGDLTGSSTVLVEIAGGDVDADDVYVLGATFAAAGGPGSLGFFQVEIAAGAAEAELEVFAVSDNIFEPDEDVVVRITSVLSNGTVSPTGAAVARGTILNDDPGNAAPVASDFTRALDEDFLGSLFSLGALTTDPDNNAIAWAITSVAGVTLTGFDPLSGFGAITSIPDFNGQARIEWTVTDAGGLSDSASYFIDIAPVNDAPVFVVDAPVNISAGQTATIIGASLLANDTDADGDPLSILQFSATTTAGGTVANTAFDTFVYTPPIGFTGTDTVSYVISDGSGGTADATLTINVAPPINQAPTDIALSKATVGSNRPAGTLVGVLAATDPDIGDTLSFSFAPGGNPGGRFAIDGDALETAIPLPFPSGAARQVTLRVTDQDGAFYDETFVIMIGRDRIGTPAGERIGGRDSDDRLRGLGGDDELLGRNGNDLLEGGEGDDSVAGGAGDDTLHGDAGNDRLMAGGGDDSIAGGGGRDTISAGEGADTVSGGGDAGTAVLRGPPGQQRVVVTEADYIDLRRPGTLLPDGDADLLLYAVGTDGVDLVRGFEAGRDAIRVTLNGDSLAVREVTNGTWIGFAGDPGGVLLLGATGLVLGTDILIG